MHLLYLSKASKQPHNLSSSKDSHHRSSNSNSNSEQSDGLRILESHNRLVRRMRG